MDSKDIMLIIVQGTEFMFSSTSISSRNIRLMAILKDLLGQVAIMNSKQVTNRDTTTTSTAPTVVEDSTINKEVAPQQTIIITDNHSLIMQE